MAEQFPEDHALLALTEDAETGVPYIPTGQSPYYLAFRRLVQRAMLVAQRANDLRVYEAGGLEVGVRAGRCRIEEQDLWVSSIDSMTLTPDSVTHLWVNAAGLVQTGTSGLPMPRSSILPLAEVTTDSAGVTSLVDLRGLTFLQTPSPGAIGLTATPAEINQALDGIDASVTASNLSILTQGSSSTADGLHQHVQSSQDLPGQATFRFVNASTDSAANVALAFSVPEHELVDAVLRLDRATNTLEQFNLQGRYRLVGSVHAQALHAGELTGNVTGLLAGAVPIDGVVQDVIVTAGSNLQTSQSSDQVVATSYVNGTALCSTDPSLSVADGVGTVSTQTGAGTAAVIKSDGTEQVQRGDLITVDLTRTVVGSGVQEARDLVVLVVIRADRPE